MTVVCVTSDADVVCLAARCGYVNDLSDRALEACFAKRLDLECEVNQKAEEAGYT